MLDGRYMSLSTLTRGAGIAVFLALTIGGSQVHSDKVAAP
jgi:hypothetical protein